MGEKHFVIHSGYDGTSVLELPYRLFPWDALQELVKEGRLGSLDTDVFVACGNCASVAASQEKGRRIAEALEKRGVTAAILTST
jgi:glycine/betaine/sarcosine/D-proline reductase family selenoprotein B